MTIGVLSWLLWGIVLMLQNAAFTWTSRARNADSLKEHGIASFFSNSVYFVTLIVGVDKIREGLMVHNYWLLAFTAMFYTMFTMIGALWSHHLLLKRKAKGKIKIHIFDNREGRRAFLDEIRRSRLLNRQIDRD